MKSVFLGWFCKPEPKVVIDCPALSDATAPIVNHFLNQGAVIMLYERPTFEKPIIVRDDVPKHLQSKILVWGDIDTLSKGLEFSDFYIHTECNSQYLGISRSDVLVSNLNDVLNINLNGEA